MPYAAKLLFQELMAMCIGRWAGNEHYACGAARRSTLLVAAQPPSARVARHVPAFSPQSLPTLALLMYPAHPLLPPCRSTAHGGGLRRFAALPSVWQAAKRAGRQPRKATLGLAPSDTHILFSTLVLAFPARCSLLPLSAHPLPGFPLPLCVALDFHPANPAAYPSYDL